MSLKRFLKKGRWVNAVKFKIEAGYWVFLKGVVLGAYYRSDLEVLARCFTVAGKEQDHIEILEKRAETKLDEIPAKDGTFYALWSSMELGGLDFNQTFISAQSDKEQMRLGDAMDMCNNWVMDGIGFGGRFPKEAISIWSETYGRTDQDRSRSRRRGLPLGDELIWEDVELGVIEDLSEFITESFSHLLEPLGLTATMPSYREC
ncbi:MAG: hypothetical protein IH960_08875 [Chloroflexi bacterium]|nr:hypothetical protein [Chloroflexota bacterium]